MGTHQGRSIRGSSDPTNTRRRRRFLCSMLAEVGAPFAPGDLTACANDPSIFDKLRQMEQMSNFAKEHVPWVVFHRGEQNMQGELFTDLCAKLNAKGAHPSGCTVMGRRLL